MTDEKQTDQGELTPEGASASCDSADPGLVEAVAERSRRALAEARPGSAVTESARDDHAEIIVPVAQPGAGTTNTGCASVETETITERGTVDLSAKLIADARQAISVEPEAAGEPGADQWYVSDIAVDCDTDTLLRVLAHGLLAAGWRPPLPKHDLRLMRSLRSHPALDGGTIGCWPPLPDSETEWQWGVKLHDGSILPLIHGDTETRARAIQASSLRGAAVLRREVGPWIEVPRG